MLRRGGFLVQPLAGFDDALLNQAALMQVAVVDPPQAGPNARLLTGLAKGVLDDGRQPITWSITPEFDRAYNPFRAGFIDVAGPAFSLVAVDAFRAAAPDPAVERGACGDRLLDDGNEPWRRDRARLRLSGAAAGATLPADVPVDRGRRRRDARGQPTIPPQRRSAGGSCPTI